VTLDRDDLALLVHEVRSPVAALAAVAEAARAHTMDAAARLRLIELALDACAAVDRLVRDAAVGIDRLERVDVVGLVRDVADAASLAGGARIAIAAPGSPLVVPADPVRLRQALDNLVRNAVSASPPGAEIAVDVSCGADTVRIAVSDSGRGISEDDLERIFEPGVRLANDQPGSGLGLAIARAIVDAHGGTLSVESTVGIGSTFAIILPRR
jgi:signal transduction histidine kinase